MDQKTYSLKLKKKMRNTEIKRDIFKALAYPTLGNLPFGAQTFLEKKLGKENYNVSNAFAASLFTNFIAYSAIAFSLPENGTPLWLRASTTIIGALYGLIEAAMRTVGFEKEEPHASLIGKIVSLPVEIPLFLYRNSMEYKKFLEGRIDDKVKVEINRTEERELELRQKIIRHLYSNEEIVKRTEIYEKALKSEQRDLVEKLYDEALEDRDFESAKKLAGKLGTEEKIKVAKAENEYLGVLIDYQALPFELQKEEVEPYMKSFLKGDNDLLGDRLQERNSESSLKERDDGRNRKRTDYLKQ